MPLPRLLLTISALAIACTAFWMGRASAPSYQEPQTRAELLAYLQGYNLTPCFFRVSAASVHLRAIHDATSQGASEHAVVQAGLEQGTPIPDHCFAVQTGLGGLSTTYWQQPSQDHLRMPAWNPLDATNS